MSPPNSHRNGIDVRGVDHVGCMDGNATVSFHSRLGIAEIDMASAVPL
jgi:hypothetical protein